MKDQKSNSQGAGSALNGGIGTPFSWRGGYQTALPDRATWVGEIDNPLYRFTR